MWPLKAHYTLWFGSLSGILPYVPIFARTHIGVSATAVGILYFALPFIVSVGKPLVCSAADHYSRHVEVLLSTQMLTLIGYGTLVMIPFVIRFIPSVLLWCLFCFLALVGNTAMGVGVSLTDYLVMHEVNQINQHGGDTNYGKFRIWGTVGFGVFGILSGIINEYSANLPYLLPGLIMFIVIEVFDIVAIYRFYYLPNKRSHHSTSVVITGNEHHYIDDQLYHDDEDEDSNENLHSVVTGSNGQQPITGYSNQFVENGADSHVYLPTTVVESGKKSSKLNHQQQRKTIKNKLPLWSRLLLRIKLAYNAVVVTSKQIFRIYYYYPSLIQHTFIIFCFGILTAFHWSFFFWFLEEIRGKDPLLMGLCIFVESFIGEIPVFWIAHRIIASIGPVLSFCVALGAFAVRYLCYGYLLDYNPGRYWDILLIETLQGLTFSLFYTVMTHVAQYYADKCDQIPANAGSTTVALHLTAAQATQSSSHGHMISGTSKLSLSSSVDDCAEGENESSMIADSQRNTLRSSNSNNGAGTLGHSHQTTTAVTKPSATMQALMSACYEGIGLGVGSLLGGYLIDYFDIFFIWRSAAFLSIALVVFNLVIELCKWFRNNRR